MRATRRALPLLLLAIGAAGWAWLSPKVPHDQQVEIALGDRAPTVDELTVRYSQKDETLQQVSLHFDRGAPNLVHHTPHLPDGEYLVEIETNGKEGLENAKRNVKLEDGRTTQIHAENAR